MKKRCKDQPERIELVHKQVTPVAGPSLYEEALANGFTGTFDQFKDSLKGEPGKPGEPGTPGQPGQISSPQSITDLFGI